jgi:hypothetical protein
MNDPNPYWPTIQAAALVYLLGRQGLTDWARPNRWQALACAAFILAVFVTVPWR